MYKGMQNYFVFISILKKIHILHVITPYLDVGFSRVFF